MSTILFQSKDVLFIYSDSEVAMVKHNTIREGCCTNNDIFTVPKGSSIVHIKDDYRVYSVPEDFTDFFKIYETWNKKSKSEKKKGIKLFANG